MAALTIRCQFCGLSRQVSASAAEAEVWQRGQRAERYCDQCKGMTHWTYAGSVRLGSTQFDELEARAEPGEPAEPVRLLVIDDDPSILTLLQKVLGGADYLVEQADSARGALLKLVNESFDLIISDIRMPGMDGKKLYRFVEEYLPEYRRRVIFLTGDQHSDETREFLEDTTCPYSFKPINFGELMRLVSELLAEVGRKGD